jgi:hypothetical protein
MSMKKLLEANVAYGRRRISQVFADFCQLSALAIRNSVDGVGRDAREAQYLEITKGYTPEEVDRFSQILALLVAELETGLSDVLGMLYMSLDLGSDRLGQFFTPYDVSRLIAQMTIGDVSDRLSEAQLAGRDFITVGEPACGSGGMVVALADSLRGAGINYQQIMHVTAQDLDLTAVRMAYIQFSLLHIPAVVIHGNTLTLEQLDVWPTPAHVLGNWGARLNHRAATSAVNGPELTLVPPLAQPQAPAQPPAEELAGDHDHIDIEGAA